MQTQIVPVAVFPGEATRFFLRSGPLGPPPSYYYQLQAVTVVKGSPAVGVEGEEGYVPSVADSEQVVVLKDGNVNMTEQQWADWQANLGVVGDEEYQLTAIAANLGLTRA